MEIAFAEAVDEVSTLVDWIMVILVAVGVSTYLYFLTRKKFARIREADHQFKKIKVLTSDF